MGSEEPSADYNIWIDPNGTSTDELATKKDLENIKPEPDEYIKKATVDGNKLTLTNKDNSVVDFEPSGGGGGLESIVAGTGDSATLFNYKIGENDEQSYGYGTIDADYRGTHKATGKFANAFGYLTSATGDYSFAMGMPDIVHWNQDNVSYRCPVASGKASFAGGSGRTTAIGIASFAFGSDCTTYKTNAVALGSSC